MARARNIKPGFFKNDDLAACGMDGRLLFAGLWTLADREGRLENRPARIKAEVFPYDNVDVSHLLEVLRDGGFVTLYRHEKQNYIQINKFREHQNPHMKEIPSTIPAPDKSVPAPEIPVAAVLIPDSLLPITDSVENPLSAEADDVTQEIELIRKAYPRTQGKPKSVRAIQKAIDREKKLRGTRKDSARFLLKRATVYRHYNAEWPPGDRKQFTPLCATWFNDERYNDDDSTYQRQFQNGKTEQRTSEIEDAGRKAEVLVGIRPDDSEVLPDSPRSAAIGAGRGDIPRREPHPRIIDGGLQVLPRPERQRVSPEAWPVDRADEESGD